MARQVVTGNDSIRAFYKNFIYRADLNRQQRKLLRVQTYFDLTLIEM